MEISRARGSLVWPLQALEEVKVREMAILDLQKKIVDGENKVKQQQNLYEAVRSDRNLYSKNLIEAQDEIEEMKRKFKIMNHQVEQLKEEIAAKDLALVKEHFDHMKVSRHPLPRAAMYAKSPSSRRLEVTPETFPEGVGLAAREARR